MTKEELVEWIAPHLNTTSWPSEFTISEMFGEIEKAINEYEQTQRESIITWRGINQNTYRRIKESFYNTPHHHERWKPAFEKTKGVEFQINCMSCRMDFCLQVIGKLLDTIQMMTHDSEAYQSGYERGLQEGKCNNSSVTEEQ